MYLAVLKSNHEDLQALIATDGSERDIFWYTKSLKQTLGICNILDIQNIC